MSDIYINYWFVIKVIILKFMVFFRDKWFYVVINILVWNIIYYG